MTFSDLVRTGIIKVGSWKPMPIHFLTDAPEATVADILLDVYHMVGYPSRQPCGSVHGTGTLSRNVSAVVALASSSCDTSVSLTQCQEFARWYRTHRRRLLRSKERETVAVAAATSADIIKPSRLRPRCSTAPSAPASPLVGDPPRKPAPQKQPRGRHGPDPAFHSPQISPQLQHLAMAHLIHQQGGGTGGVACGQEGRGERHADFVLVGRDVLFSQLVETALLALGYANTAAVQARVRGSQWIQIRAIEAQGHSLCIYTSLPTSSGHRLIVVLSRARGDSTSPEGRGERAGDSPDLPGPHGPPQVVGSQSPVESRAQRHNGTTARPLGGRAPNATVSRSRCFCVVEGGGTGGVACGQEGRGERHADFVLVVGTVLFSQLVETALLALGYAKHGSCAGQRGSQWIQIRAIEAQGHSLCVYTSLPTSSGHRLIVVLSAVVAIRVVALVGGQRAPPGLVRGGTVNVRFHHGATLGGRVSRPSHARFPLVDFQLDRRPLVHGGHALKVVQEAQHAVVDAVDLPADAAASSVAGRVQQEGDVVLAGDDQRIPVDGARGRQEAGLTVGRVEHAVVVRLALLQGPVDEDVRHVNPGPVLVKRNGTGLGFSPVQGGQPGSGVVKRNGTGLGFSLDSLLRTHGQRLFVRDTKYRDRLTSKSPSPVHIIS
ncbi:hypothetical protein CRUP_014921 [Coryphaenoides rupestris]|nr:hypothetical protein CRUP_014921 [Coryphaenoides rupestris]